MAAIARADVAELSAPARVDEEILSNWQTFNQRAREQGIQPDPAIFARAFGDEFSKY
jgi:hypothetical protein